MSNIAYYRVSTQGQTIDTQRRPFQEVTMAREFIDLGVSGKTLMSARPQASAMLDFVREGDLLHVYALDRLGRDSIDVQTTVRDLLGSGVRLYVHGIGEIAPGPTGALVVALLAQVADMERARINERTSDGKRIAREAFAATGKTHHGKASLGGRPAKHDPAEIAVWRKEHGASLTATAQHFRASVATVKRACAASKV